MRQEETVRIPKSSTQDEILNHMREMMNAYSSELFDDLSGTEKMGAKRLRALGREQWKVLVKMLGREPTEAEMFPNDLELRESKEPCQPSGL